MYSIMIATKVRKTKKMLLTKQYTLKIILIEIFDCSTYSKSIEFLKCNHQINSLLNKLLYYNGFTMLNKNERRRLAPKSFFNLKG